MLISDAVYKATVLILQFISCVTFCYACYLQYKTMTMFKKDKRKNRIQTTVLDKAVKELKKKDADEKETENKIKEKVKEVL